MSDFQIVTSIPTTLNPGAMERAIAAFIEDTKRDVVKDNVGRYNQLVYYVYNALVRKTLPDVQIWIKQDEDKEVGAFAFTNFSIDVDGKQSLWMSVAWVRRTYRFTGKPKQWFRQMEDFGKASGAKHLLIPSIRGSKGYLRFVGKEWQEYEVILKKDL